MSQQMNECRPSAISLYELTVAAIRTYALYVLLGSISYALQTIAFYLAGEGKNMQGYNPYLAPIAFVIGVSTAFFLFLKSDSVAALILAGRESSEDTLALNASALVSAALTVVGISFLVSGLQGLVGRWAVWFFAAKDEMTGNRASMQTLDISSLVGSGVRFTAGLILIIGIKRINRIWLNIREFFRLKDDPEIQSEPSEIHPSDGTSGDSQSHPV